MVKYEIILNDRNNWVKTLAYFTNLYAMQKSYSEDRTEESGIKSAANATRTYLPASISNATFNMNRGVTTGSITLMQ